MISEVELLSPGGVPVYYHSNDEQNAENNEQPSYMIQASFITALTQFANELENGDVELISMERKQYLLKKSPKYTLIFTTKRPEHEDIREYEDYINTVSNYLDTKLENYDLNDTNLEKLDKPINDLNEYLIAQDLITDSDKYDSNQFRENVNSFVFAAVGYEPGVCNIGEKERQKRLSYGLLFFLISIILFGGILYFSLPAWTAVLLFFPNIAGFIGFYQYFYQFCVTNAMNETYHME